MITRREKYAYQFILVVVVGFSLSQISPGHYGNTAGRCQDVGSLGVGVQLRPPPVFIHRRPPIPPPGPSLAGSVFLNRKRGVTHHSGFKTGHEREGEGGS
ncbi:hypothetical protein NQZ68_005149 [Dissostichus eleginoides]|uniref:Disabled like 2 n=1 Tax=Dissostichus eleginoides TaxID=100907 RepID=A0AAD9BW89_DISEL|nr:hypothetical protein NQZ68_005149 [Dissostichus eleginoides]KAK1889019.1 Disabled like 2 [Dissostichus eleginoides]